MVPGGGVGSSDDNDGGGGGGDAAVAHHTLTDVRWASLPARRAVVARPAAAPPIGAQRNRHGNRSPLPLTNPFGTADRH